MTVTVTATLVVGYEWAAPLSAGWTQVNASTATWTGVVLGTSCSERRPVAPTPTQAKCLGGVLEPPSLTPAKTDNITYASLRRSSGGAVHAGADGCGDGDVDPGGWPPESQMPGWSITSLTTATYR